MPVTVDEASFGDPVIVQNVGGLAGLPVLDGSQLTGVTSSPAVLQVTVDFGNATGPTEGDTAVFTVSSGTVSLTSKFIMTCAGGTADHDLDDVVVEGIVAYASNIIAGVSYDVVAYAPQGSWGRYFVNVIVQ